MNVVKISPTHRQVPSCNRKEKNVMMVFVYFGKKEMHIYQLDFCYYPRLNSDVPMES